MSKEAICMIVQSPAVRGGIAAVVNGYRDSKLEEEFTIYYVESYKDGSRLSKLWKAFFGFLHFVKVVMFNRPTLIHIHSSFGPSFYRKLPYIYFASYKKTPIINHIHGADFETFYFNASQKKKNLISKTYNKCSKLIALSDEWRENLKIIVPEENIAVIHNYSTPHLDALQARRDRDLNNQILFLGEIGARKGCYDIPTVVEKVSKVIPNVKFVLAGMGDIEQINTLLENKGVSHNVEFPGWVRGESKDQLLRESDIFFLPSYNEGMPMAILDAMGYGLPIISTNVGGIPQIVQLDKNGYTCEPGDTEGFANYMIELLLNRRKLYDFGECSYETVEEKYSLKLHLNSLEELYIQTLREVDNKPISYF